MIRIISKICIDRLKPLSDAQLEENWTESMMNAFMKLGEKYPDIAGEIYVVATP